MASFRPFLPPTTQNPPPSQQRGSQYSQNWGGAGDGSVPYTNQMQGNSNYLVGRYASSTTNQQPRTPANSAEPPRIPNDVKPMITANSDPARSDFLWPGSADGDYGAFFLGSGERHPRRVASDD